ncbi:MAG TPA: amidohydrolase family protein, partial [Clostridiales bacterium]|nr:amidohydrolase family protein [Clostridiales bacterium]
MDVILFNGSVYTVDKDRPHAQAVGIKGNKIALVGSDEEVLAQRTDATKVYDMEGRSVIPGINDGHVHLLNHGIIQDNIILQGCKNREEVIRRSKDYIAERNIPHGDWVVGRGWDQNLFPEKVMLTRHDLDEISTDHPVVLTRVCGCMCVANTAALR